MSDDECRKQVEEAAALSKAGQFGAALAAYQAAYLRHEMPWLLVNIGRMQQKLGRQEEALNSYQQFLETELAKTDAALRDRVQGYLAEAADIVAQSDACMTDAECRREVNEASSLSQSSQFGPALAIYQSAYARHGVPWLLVNIGRMQQKLGKHEESLEAYQRFLQTGLGKANATLRVRVQGYLAEAENTVAEQKKQTAAEQARLAERQTRLTDFQERLTLEQARLKARSRPLYKRWWFWTIAGGATVAGVAAIAVGVALSNQTSEPGYVSGLPEFRPFP